MATIYRGTGWSSDCVGETKNGTVYRGTGWSSSEVGEYKDGTIYCGCGLHSDAIGKYKNGTIYTGLGLHSREVGEYKDGTIYRGDWLEFYSHRRIQGWLGRCSRRSASAPRRRPALTLLSDTQKRPCPENLPDRGVSICFWSFTRDYLFLYISS